MPVLGEHGAAIGFNLAESDGAHAALFEAKAESADAGKEVENIQVSLLLWQKAQRKAAVEIVVLAGMFGV